MLSVHIIIGCAASFLPKGITLRIHVSSNNIAINGCTSPFLKFTSYDWKSRIGLLFVMPNSSPDSL